MLRKERLAGNDNTVTVRIKDPLEQHGNFVFHSEFKERSKKQIKRRIIKELYRTYAKS